MNESQLAVADSNNITATPSMAVSPDHQVPVDPVIMIEETE